MRRALLAALAVVLVAGLVAPATVGAVAVNNSTDGNETATAPTEFAPDIYVEQPRWVGSSVDESTVDGVQTFTVKGATQEIALQNVGSDAVVRAGVREDSATLRYDKGIDRWVLDTQGQAGTYRVFWVVRQGDGTPQTVQANIKVTQAQFEHLPPSRLESLRQKAELWDWTRDKLAEYGIVSRDVSNEQLKEAITDAAIWYGFYLNPLSALTGQFFTLAIMLAKWPAGWIIFAVLFAIYFVRDRKKTKENRRLKRQFADIGNVEAAEREAWEREIKRFLSRKEFQDLGLTDADAQAIREHFDVTNPRQFYDRLRSAFDEYYWVRLILSAYDQLDYRLVYSDDGPELVPPDETVAADGGSVRLAADEALAEADREVLDGLDWAELDPNVLWHEDVDGSALDLPVGNGPDAEGDLVDAFDVAIGEDGDQYHVIERREEFVEIMLEIIEHIAASEHCDEEGRIRPEADLLDFLYTFTETGAEKYRLPLFHVRDILLRCRQQLDADSRMQSLADGAEEGRL